MPEEPEFPVVFEYLWSWFSELSVTRSGGGFGPSSLSWQDLNSWANMTGLNPTPWECRTLLRIDNVFMTHLAKKQKNEGAQNG